MTHFDNTDGTWLALGAVAALAGLTLAVRGSAAHWREPVDLEVEVEDPGFGTIAVEVRYEPGHPGDPGTPRDPGEITMLSAWNADGVAVPVAELNEQLVFEQVLDEVAG